MSLDDITIKLASNGQLITVAHIEKDRESGWNLIHTNSNIERKHYDNRKDAIESAWSHYPNNIMQQMRF